jgi:hypothetical protein
MRSSTELTGRDHWSRPLLLVVILSVGAACGGSSHGELSRGVPTTPTRQSAESGRSVDGQHHVIPSPLGAAPGEATARQVPTGGAQAAPAPPIPSLAGQHPEAPPNTVSLDALHRQGRTHILR